MNATERYMDARECMIMDGIPVPPDVLRAHLDLVRGVIRLAPGLHPMVITVTATATRTGISLFDDIPAGTILRVEGQSFKDTWV